MSKDFAEDLDGLDWEDWMFIGPESGDGGCDRRERDRLLGNRDTFEEDYWDVIDSGW